MKKFAVIGKDVSKSISPQIHQFIASNINNDLVYEKLSIPEPEFRERAESLFGEYVGFNVTIPYKLAIMPFLSKIEGDAKAFGAVNTVTAHNRTGYNTDGQGFMLMLESNGIEVDGKKVLLLGAGGAGRSVAKKLADAGAHVYVHDTHLENSERLANEFKNVTAIKSVEPKPYYVAINATGIGMHTTEGISPVGAEIIKLCDVAVDLIYTPEKSAFLQLAESFNKKIVNGKAMLFYQAYFAQCIFFDKLADIQQAKQLFNKFTEEVL